MERNLAFEANAELFRQQWLPHEDALSQKIEQARTLINKVTYSSRNLLSIAALTSSLNVDGHRSDLVILKTSRAHAAFEGRTSITDRDIALAAELALPHRIKRGPFHQSEMTMEDLQERIEQLQGATASAGEPEPQPGEETEASGEKKK
jgi:Mg-chelatase subunit ChlI